MAKIKASEMIIKYRVQVCQRCKKNTFCQVQHDWKNPEANCGINRWDKDWEVQELKRIQKEKEQKEAAKEYQRSYGKAYRQKPEYKEKQTAYMREYMKDYQRRPDVAERINVKARERRQKKKEEALQNVAV